MRSFTPSWGICQKRGDDLELAPTVNVKMVDKWHAIITLYVHALIQNQIRKKKLSLPEVDRPLDID